MGEERRRIHCCAVHHCFQQRQCTQSAHDHRSCLHGCAQRPQLSPSQRPLPAGLCVRGGEFGAHPEVITSGINLNQHTRRDGWIDGWMDGWMVAGEKRLEAEFPLRNLWRSQSGDHLENNLAKLLMWKKKLKNKILLHCWLHTRTY